jgi:hypothetical protein
MIVARQAHVADRNTMGCNKMAGPVEKEKGWVAPRKKRTARCRDGGKSGWGWHRELERRKLFLKKFKQVIGNAI